MYIEKLKEMFTQVVIEKNASLIPEYYHADFLCMTNGQTIPYDDFLESHTKYYATEIAYTIAYDENAFVEQANKIAGRVFITIAKPGEQSHKIEVILIAEYKNNQLYRLWETTFPDWSNLEALKND